MEKVQLTIDDKQVEVPKGTTIYKAAKEVGIDIPVLCYMNLEDIGIENKPGGCRVCSVEVEGRKNLAPACATEVYDGMVVKTHTMRVINARRTVVEFILSDHPKDCLTCKKSGNCELQSLAIRLGIREIPGQEYAEMSTYKTDYSPSIVRELDKCIMCRRCEKMCNEFQTVGALYAFNRGFNAAVAPAFEMDLQYSPCTYCGQCVAVCPTAALTEVDHSRDLIDAISDPNTTVIAQTAPAVRAALGEEFGYEPGTLVTGKMVSALRRLGFDYVFDTDFAADLTIMEEGTEMLDRLSKYLDGDKDVQMPILTSCCPAWVNFIEHHFPDLKDVPSSARSPQQMFGSIAKTYFAEQINKKRENVVVVSIMPCLAKKYESQREEFKVDDNPDVDFSVTTRELAHLIKEANFNLKDMEDQDFDRPMGESTGAGVMFGTTGGVIEAATRTAYEWYTGNALDNSIVFEQLRGFEGIRKATVDFKGTNINIGIAHGLGNARKLLEEIKQGTSEFHAIEIMACPGGCIGGGGQPLHHNDTGILKARQQAIYEEDKNKPIRKSHENPEIKKLYEEYLGKPMGEKAHKLLHTQYFDLSRKIEIE